MEVKPKRQEQTERQQEMREYSWSKDKPNPPRHRSAATLGFC